MSYTPSVLFSYVAACSDGGTQKIMRNSRSQLFGCWIHSLMHRFLRRCLCLRRPFSGRRTLCFRLVHPFVRACVWHSPDGLLVQTNDAECTPSQTQPDPWINPAVQTVSICGLVSGLVQSLRGPRVQKNVREVSLHFHELDHLAEQKSEGRLFVTRQ